MPYAFTLTTTIPASAQDIYDAWLDSFTHSEMTGGEASMSDEVGAEVAAWDGYITGRNIELVPAERIVQSWRTTQFAASAKMISRASTTAHDSWHETPAAMGVIGLCSLPSRAQSGAPQPLFSRFQTRKAVSHR